VAQVVEHSVQSSEFKVTPPKKYAHKIPVEWIKGLKSIYLI
jgi:hypothetical protein